MLSDTKSSIDLEKDLTDKFKIVKTKLKLPVERIGNWLWCECLDDVRIKQLKTLGFKYSNTRKMYYYTNQEPKRLYKQSTFEELRALYNVSQLTING